MDKASAATPHECKLVVPGTFTACGEGGNYCSQECLDAARAAAKARKLTVGVPAELLAAATPRPWRWREDTWSIVGPRNEQAIVGGPKGTLVFISPNIQLALRAVNEYETLLAVEEKLRAFVDLWRGVPVGPDSFGQALAAARAALARLEEVRGG